MIVQLINNQEKNRVNELFTKEIIKTINKQYNNIKENEVIIIVKKLLNKKIVLYINNIESRTRL